MGKEEKIFLGLAIAALAAIVIFQKRPVTVDTPPPHDPVADIGMSITPRNDSVTRGLEYMTYNAPWFFAPPVGNFLPSVTAGLGSQTVNQPTDFQPYSTIDDCGCT